MEVPRLGVESELQLPAYTTATVIQIQATSATYTTAHGNAGSPTHWVRSGIKPASSWILVGLTTEPRRELPEIYSLFYYLESWVLNRLGRLLNMDRKGTVSLRGKKNWGEKSLNGKKGIKLHSPVQTNSEEACWNFRIHEWELSDYIFI